MAWKSKDIKSSYVCNADLLKHFRELRGWTQEDLAEKSGYSLRLVSKAEGGNSISSDTVADLAEALSGKDDPVYPEDLVYDPVEFARQYIDALYTLQRNAFDRIGAFVDDNVVTHIQGDPSEIPFAGTFHGIDGLHEMLAKFFAVLEVPQGYDHSERYQFIGSGTEVIVWGESWIHPIGHPLTAPVEIAIRMKFRRGKLVSFEDRFDVKSGAAAIAKLKGDGNS